MARLVLIPRESENFPLPADYVQLTREGQRQARVNACRLWLSVNGDYWGPDLLPICVEFFDRAYLRAEEGAFYPPGIMRPNPAFHSDILRFVASNKTALIAAPRDSAKSTLIYKTIALQMLSAHLYFITYVSSTNKNTRRAMTTLIRLFRWNRALNDDFGPEMGGRIIPTRGELPFGSEEMNLRNGCRLMQSSIESRNRGDRPMWLWVDDPEYDGKASTDKTIMREDVERHILQEMVPMVQNAGAHLSWFGTTISRRHLLTAVMESDDEAHRMWGRMRLKALYRKDRLPVTSLVGVQPDDLISIWPERYSVSDYLQLATRLRSHFWAEYMSDPKAVVGVGVTLDKRHEYRIGDPDEALTTEPWRSKAVIEWEDTNGQVRSLPLSEFLSQMTVIQTVDWAMSTSATSDYSAVATVAHTPDNQLIVLDMWAGRVTGDQLATACIAMARKWRPDVVGVEAPSVRHHMMHLIKTRFTDAASKGAWFPVVRPITDPWKKGEKKADRISGLLWRFGDEDSDKPVHIKLPMWRDREPAIRMLLDQIREFKPGVEGGDLRHDDCLVSGTKILCKRGEVPIEQVMTDDHVLTRQGWKRVLRSWCTGVKEVIHRAGLTGTPNHPVWTHNRRWVPLSDIQEADILDGFGLPFYAKERLVLPVDDFEKRQPTYNLTVEDCPEFFANGVLVHNCYDALSMSQSLILGNPRWKGKPDPEPDPLSLIASGQFVDEAGRPLAALVGGLERIPPAILEKALDAARNKPRPKGKSRA